ncbi:MAG: TRAP transporter small permease subunit [Campylobacterales bacterium]|nr:TRAP transporter small permease subunit [Campylobacterales bacterium]
MIDKSMQLLSYFTAFILVALVGIVFYDALVRYFFSEGSIALQELEWHFFDVVILLSIAYALKHDAHVRVDIFYDGFSEKTKALIDIFSLLVFVLPFSFLIIYIGVGFVEMSYVQHEASSNPGGLSHRWIVKSLMPLAFIFVALSAVERVIITFKKLKAL